MKAYIDESGNSGDHIFDPQQPIYSCSIVWLNQSDETKIEKKVRELIKQHGIRGGELKGSKLVKSNDGLGFLSELVDLLCEQDVKVSLMSMQKTFMASAVLISECTDYVYNPAFDPSWTHPEKQVPVARLINKVIPENALLSWWSAYRKQSVDELRVATAELAKEMRISSIDFGEFPDCLECVNYEQLLSENDEAGSGTGTYSPNQTMFVQVVLSVSTYVHEQGLVDLEVVHDEQHQYKDKYEYYVNLFRGDGEPQEMSINDNAVVLPLKIRSFGFQDSKKCIWLQIADCMAVIARVVVESIDSDHPKLLRASRKLLPKVRKLSQMIQSSVYQWAIGLPDWQMGAYSRLMGFENIEDAKRELGFDAINKPL